MRTDVAPQHQILSNQANRRLVFKGKKWRLPTHNAKNLGIKGKATAIQKAAKAYGIEIAGGDDWDDGKTADERQLDANTVGSKQVADDEAWLENQYLASQPHIEIDGVNYPINPGVSLADGAQTTEGEITGANYMANLSGTKSVTIRGSNTAGPDYLVTADDGSQFYVEEKTLIGDSKNTLSNNIKAAIGNFESKGTSSEAAAQASAGQAKVVINATGTVNWNNPDNVRAYMDRIANSPDFVKMNQLTVLTTQGPITWTRP